MSAKSADQAYLTKCLMLPFSHTSSPTLRPLHFVAYTSSNCFVVQQRLPDDEEGRRSVTDEVWDEVCD